MKDWPSIPRRRGAPAPGWAACGLVVLRVAPVALGAEPAPEPSAFSLFRPVPAARLRELTTDRPDKTETPFTVDAGHFQVEMDLFGYTRDRSFEGGVERLEESWSAGPVNLKAGLLPAVDLQLVLSPYRWERVEERDAGGRSTERRSGYGDTVLRSKINLWGNDGGKTALALLPLLKFPTSQDGLGNDAFEGGLIVPFEIELPRGLSLGFNAGWLAARNEADDGYHARWVHSVALGYSLSRRISGYVEFWSEVSGERGADWAGTFDFGFNLLLAPNLKLDVGLNIGVTEAADDWNPFVGLSWRH